MRKFFIFPFLILTIFGIGLTCIKSTAHDGDHAGKSPHEYHSDNEQELTDRLDEIDDRLTAVEEQLGGTGTTPTSVESAIDRLNTEVSNLKIDQEVEDRKNEREGNLELQHEAVSHIPVLGPILVSADKGMDALSPPCDSCGDYGSGETGHKRTCAAGHDYWVCPSLGSTHSLHVDCKPPPRMSESGSCSCSN